MFNLPRLTDESFVRQVEFLATVDSTNNLAAELALRDEIETPLLVLAAEQTAGRGRGANTWWSGPGSLTWSLILDAESLGLSPENWPRVSLTAALAVCEMVQEILPNGSSRCGIKWPNDVHVNAKKICGVLPELPRPVSHGRPLPKRLILGVGINVNNSLAAAPPEIQQIATALCDLTSQTHNLTDVLLAVLQRLPIHLTELAEGDLALADAWSERCLLRGRTVELIQGERRIWGECGGIAPDGGLWLDGGDGPKRFYSGVVAKVE